MSDFEFEFDFEFYLNEYIDLITAGINDYQKSLNHWNERGISEGRYCSNKHKLFKLNKLKENKLKSIGKTFGFIITSCIKSEKQNNYWIESYKCIRKLYPSNIIMIILDNYNDYFYKIPQDIKLDNCFIIDSEYPGSGELLPYYYFNKYNLFETAIILHDSAFIQEKINTDVNTVKFIWHFKKSFHNIAHEINLLSNLTNIDLNKYNYEEWYGCFGCQSIININFLKILVDKYNLFNLLDVINNREFRCCLERIFGFLCCQEELNLLENPSLINDIQKITGNNYTFENYKNQNKYDHPIVKVFSGR